MRVIALLSLLLFLPIRGGAQSLQPTPQRKTAEKEKDAPVPKKYLPPPGMCRIWVDNVPANRQPAPTNCPTAIRNKPPNARVVFPPGKDRDQKARPGRTRADTAKRKPPA